MHRRSATRPWPLLAAALVAVLLVSSGCYRRVVGARGLGTGGTRIEEPREQGFLDSLLGPEPEPARSGTRMRVN